MTDQEIQNPIDNEQAQTVNPEPLNDTVKQEPTATIGDLLREGRLKKGIDFNQIYDATKVRRAYIEALENNDFKALPNMLVARGYMKLYAEFLGLDVNYFVDRFNELFPEEATGSNGPRNPKENDTKFNIFIPKKQLVPTALRSMNSGGGIQFSMDSRVRINKKLVYNTSLTVGLVLLAIILSNIYFSNTVGSIKTNPRLETDVRPLEAKVTPEVLQQKKIFNKVTVLARALNKCYVTVVMDGRLVFRGNMDAGNTKYWEADQYIRIKSSVPRNLELAVNGENPTRMADQIDILEQTYYPLKEGETATVVVSTTNVTPEPSPLQEQDTAKTSAADTNNNNSQENLFTF
jgi:hypothetical protein